ncbi:nitrite reductase small subunit NirD [Methylomarinum sp. Ch1-1]|uniref:Nitrite reductase small subunit NirD n=1 Tax=Methylomarinum roseum TaxID=3067653 RepID=A0AAU7NWX9_9GAMM|nr:nitrite reductase small subunit NirD [Methylomarinum sp. Ch1-1]MDP4522430.1 nitrite reductase small subunit NirD [Methylomarinum sp. Ch1-1]
MTEWSDICAVDDLQPDSGVCALIDNRQIAIFYLPREQAVFALDNHDPFSHANVLSRGMIGDLRGEPMVASPMYKQHFSLKTGVCLEDEAVKLQTYNVRIDKQRVQIAFGSEP